MSARAATRRSIRERCTSSPGAATTCSVRRPGWQTAGTGTAGAGATGTGVGEAAPAGRHRPGRHAPARRRDGLGAYGCHAPRGAPGGRRGGVRHGASAPLGRRAGAHGGRARVVICSNGAFVYDVAGARVLECRPIPDESVRILARDLRAALPTIAFAAERTSGFAAEAAFVSRHPVPDGAPLALRIEELLDGATGKLLAQCDAVPDADFLPLLSEVLAGRAVVADSGATGLGEISAPGVTKGATLARWAEARGYLPAEVWAFGDMPNDLPMLRWAGRSFAVANAHPAVLAEATDRCPSNEDDGVAAALETLTGPVHSGRR